MEMVEGGDLKGMVKAAGPLPAERACALAADAATALDVAHELGIIHRDVKPSNLIITRSGRCKLTDFGLVRVEDPNAPFDFTDKSVGTPQFMAPEVICREPPRPRKPSAAPRRSFWRALRRPGPPNPEPGSRGPLGPAYGVSAWPRSSMRARTSGSRRYRDPRPS